MNIARASIYVDDEIAAFYTQYDRIAQVISRECHATLGSVRAAATLAFPDMLQR